MGKFGSRFFVLLGLWVLFAQGTEAFASLPGTVQADEDNELQQAPSAGDAYFDQIEILEVQPAPQKEYPDILARGSSETSAMLQDRRKKAIRLCLHLRDHRNDLRQQIFPFHFHW